VAERRQRGFAAGKTDFSIEEATATATWRSMIPCAKAPQTRSQMPILWRKVSHHAHPHKRDYEMPTLRILPRLAAETGRARDQSGGSAAPHRRPRSRTRLDHRRDLYREEYIGICIVTRKTGNASSFTPILATDVPRPRGPSARETRIAQLHRVKFRLATSEAEEFPPPSPLLLTHVEEIQSSRSRDVRKLSTTKSATSLPSR
jgi:hypothetical protein